MGLSILSLCGPDTQEHTWCFAMILMRVTVAYLHLVLGTRVHCSPPSTKDTSQSKFLHCWIVIIKKYTFSKFVHFITIVSHLRKMYAERSYKFTSPSTQSAPPTSIVMVSSHLVPMFACTLLHWLPFAPPRRSFYPKFSKWIYVENFVCI